MQLIQTVIASEQRLCARKDGGYTFRVGNQQIWHDLYNLGGRPAKSLIAEMPSIPQELVHHFVRGFVDGSGSVYWETVPRRKPIIKMFGGIPFLEKLARAIDGETGVGVAVVRDYS